MELSAFSSALLFQVNIRHNHPFVQGLAHVIDREQGYRDAGESFHLHTSLSLQLYGAAGDDSG